jgi:hypothetical protein
MPTVAERIRRGVNSLAPRYKPYAAIAIACALLAGPLIFLRGYNSDEGLAVAIARTAVEDGEWLVPRRPGTSAPPMARGPTPCGAVRAPQSAQ